MGNDLTNWTVFNLPNDTQKPVGFVRLQQAAEMIGVHRNTLARMVKRNDIAAPQIITSRHKGYAYDYLVEWMRSRPQCAT